MVKQIGPNMSGLNGFTLLPNKIYKAKHGDIVEILHTKYFHEIVFDQPIKKEPETECVQENSTRNKRSRTITKDEILGEDIQLKKSKVERKPNEKNKWESFESGHLLIFTGEGVVPNHKV